MISEMEFKKHFNMLQLALEPNVKYLRCLVDSRWNKILLAIACGVV